MNVARLNFSHGTHDSHRQVIENIRRASLKTGKVVAILQDLGGPKIRIGEIKEGPIFLKEGSFLFLPTVRLLAMSRKFLWIFLLCLKK